MKFAHVFVLNAWIRDESKKKNPAIISLYSINWLVFTTEPDRVYCAVRTESLLGAFAKLR